MQDEDQLKHHIFVLLISSLESMLSPDEDVLGELLEIYGCGSKKSSKKDNDLGNHRSLNTSNIIENILMESRVTFKFKKYRY